MNAARLAAATCGLALKRCSIQAIVSATGRVYIHDTRPRAKKFFDRSASRGFTPRGSTAPWVRLVIGTSNTVYPSSEPSVSGLAA